MRPWPDTLAGRTVALLVGITLLMVIGGAAVLKEERQQRFEERSRYQVLERITTLARIVGAADSNDRQPIIDRLSTPDENITLDKAPRATTPPRQTRERMISRHLNTVLSPDDTSDIRVHLPDAGGIVISVRLADGRWLNFSNAKFEGPPPVAARTLQLLAAFLILLVLSGLFIAWRITRPMADLANAADRFGLGQSAEPLPEQGPREVRHTIRAFNQMQQRMHRHITERSQILAAISHDLRTPITTLRLRAEYIHDPEIREKTLATLSEMEAIVSATLSFSRDEAADEQSRTTDLAALLQSIVDDYADLGQAATYEGPDKLIIECRPTALRRAFVNLIDNALKYGGTARVRLRLEQAGIEVHIDDDGPGIPPDKLEDVFSPFFRVETSRSRDTGGVGLGLAVARSIVLAHGGTLHLENRRGDGVRAVLRLTKY